MNFSNIKYYIFIVIAVMILLVTGLYLKMNSKKEVAPEIKKEVVINKVENKNKVDIIGKTKEGRNIEVFNYPALDSAGLDTNKNKILIVGGMHGGYEWNSSLLAYELIDYFNINSSAVPSNTKLSIIPNLNADGTHKVTDKDGRFKITDIKNIKIDNAAARFNANDVDLNRNFDCNWVSTSTWRNNVVSAGTAPFSEPESKTLRDYIVKSKPDAVIFLHSASGAVYASTCNSPVASNTLKLMNVYASAAKYKAVPSFDAYKVTGDAEGWLASINIPAITVEMTSHTDIEWDKNLSGVKAVLNYYNQNK